MSVVNPITTNTVDRNREARNRAQQRVDDMAPYISRSVDYRSRGHLLIIGSARRAMDAAQELNDMPGLTLLVTDNASIPSPGCDWTCYSGSLSRLSGYLGRFSAYATVGDRERDLGTLEGIGFYDIVFDLSDQAALNAELPPAGYLHPHDQASYQEAVEQIRSLVGEFEKPRYVMLDPDRCAHSASGLVGCTRCLSICPSDAIQSAEERISVDAHLCHGMGSCATACPTNALSYDYPSLRHSIERVRALLHAYADSGGEGAVVLLHEAEDGVTLLGDLKTRLPGRVLPVQTEELGSLGLEFWLSALAFGATEVLVLNGTATSKSALSMIDDHVAIAQSLLTGLGYPATAVRRVNRDELTSIPETATGQPHNPATYAALDDKREAIELALDHLVSHGTQSPQFVTLETGAPFGTVAVSNACTLCMACVSICPPYALQSGETSPKLSFIERNCVQCGLCVQACPEQAVTLQPRYLFDHEERVTPRLLREDEAVCCLDCGTPFAPRSSIDRLKTQLSGHPMFSGSAARRLELCEECRVKEMMRAANEA